MFRATIVVAVCICVLASLTPIAPTSQTSERMAEIERSAREHRSLDAEQKAYVTAHERELRSYLQERVRSRERVNTSVLARMINLLPQGNARKELARKLVERNRSIGIDAHDDAAEAVSELIRIEPDVIRALIGEWAARPEASATQPMSPSFLMDEATLGAIVAGIARSKQKDFIPDLLAIRAKSRLARSKIDYTLSLLRGEFPVRQYRHSTPEALLEDYVRLLRAQVDVSPEQQAEFFGWDRDAQRLAVARSSRMNRPDLWNKKLGYLERLAAVPMDRWTRTEIPDDRSGRSVVYQVPGEQPIEITLHQDLSGDWLIRSIVPAPTE